MGTRVLVRGIDGGVTRPRLLIDENLSVELARVAQERGFEAAHVARLGFQGWKDWTLMEEVARHDWVIVTNNAIEFRGRYRKLELHPGVVFLLPNVRRRLQVNLLVGALDDIDRDPDLVNQALDVSFACESVVVRRYRLP